ncbi:DNA starvation/stationary phase protection protein Dps [Alicyclobacillus vulcanalis]|uniref:Starvation-inducible DNA-binding protein n=1 Tax=Alicyclobacillus vulcanalis TaxID=252246 RepID=A0A1N7N1Z9_9BACL|nr:DNA starvation/stationary phase protection protein Dps [Alicyclobacillus vulcanalis]SIS92370.1 starvation-inducible DNA-binding protein [Alicyclobacillus vulcanalis]
MATNVSRLKHTRIDLAENVKQRMVELLNTHVVHLTDLWNQTKLAHWNVRGPHFISYHEMLDELAAHLVEAIDNVAERATALGGIAGLPIQDLAAQSKLPKWDLSVTKDVEVLRALADRWAMVANEARKFIEESEEHDSDTADLFTEVSRQLDQDLWFLEAHIEH